MGLQLFQVEGGISDGRVSYLSGTGVPGGDASFQDAAGVGSYFVDNTGKRWSKHTAGAGTANWETMASTADLTAIGAVQVWREPVVAIDSVSTTTVAAVIAMNIADSVDGHVVVAGDRVLFTAFTNAGSAGSNVYIVGGATGAWTLTESANNETDGDTVAVLNGLTYINQVWLYNSATGGWGNIGSQATGGEETFIRSFIGKGAAGGELPAYTSVLFVANGDSLETAIGKLDSQVGTNTAAITQNSTAITSTQLELDNTQAGAGLAVGGAYVPVVPGSTISNATSIHSATVLLDIAMGSAQVAGVAEVANRIAAVAAVQAELDTVEASIGLSVLGAFVPFVGTSYMDTATSIVSSLALLDGQSSVAAAGLAQEIIDRAAAITVIDTKVGSAVFTGALSASTDVTVAINDLEALVAAAVAKSSVIGIAGGVVDSVLVDSAKLIVWEVAITETAVPANNRSFTIKAMHDGTAVSDATAIDHNNAASLRLGAPIAGLAVDVVLAGTGAAQVAQLTVAATGAVDVKVVRLFA